MINSNPKLLIVDDNPKNLQVLANNLELKNYKLEFSTNGKAALEWISKQKFDLILLDIMMPGMSGLQVCKKIRANPEYNDIPIIFLSADIDKNTILEGFEIGGQDYLTKPFDSRELLARVHMHLELKESKEKLKEVNQWLEDQVKERTLELENSYREIEKINYELINTDKVKVEFLNIIGHEVRTALNGIIGPIDLLKSKLGNDTLPGFVNILDLSVSRLERFSLTALAITELNTGVQNMGKNEIKMKVLFQKVIDTVPEKLLPKSLRIELAPIQDELEIKGNMRLLINCVENILDNAIKYSPMEGVIAINVIEKNSEIWCEISDQGKGFSDSAMNNLFKLFRPGEPHVDTNMGLGLAFAKLIMKAHFGKIEVEKLKNEGALVRMIFETAPQQ